MKAPAMKVGALLALLVPLSAIFIGTSSLDGQSTALVGLPLTFEVASVKPNLGTGRSFFIGCYYPGSAIELIPRGMCIARNTSVRAIVAEAYNIEAYLAADSVLGGPGWIDTARYDIEGKAENRSATPDELHAMLRSVLADRFKLEAHEESRMISGFALVVAKNGPKLKTAKGDRPSGIFATGSAPIEMQGTNSSVADLAKYLSRNFRVPIVDKTGLAGRYDFNIKFLRSDDEPQSSSISPPNTPGPPPGTKIVVAVDISFLPAISRALQNEVGLKLESQKVPSRILIIDGIARPKEND
jgi:uncharacterized protein (TIGR03435 family)